MDEIKTFSLLPRRDYEKEVKINKIKLHSYSPKQLKDAYPNGGYRIVGETKNKVKKKIIGRLVAGEQTFDVAEPGAHSKILYKRSGYVAVGRDEYIALLKNRIPFLILLFFLWLGIILALAFMLRSCGGPDEPFHPLPGTDPSQMPGETVAGTTAPPAMNGEGTINMIYTLEAGLNLSTGHIDMYFKNPNVSNQDVMIEMYVVWEENGEKYEIKIAESGRIMIGYYINTMTFNSDVAVLEEGRVYDAKYKVYAYNPKTGEKALVESTITDLKLYVKP